MGSTSSNLKRSDSSAFGRLRIDSPRITPGSANMSLHRRRQLRMAAENPNEASRLVEMPKGKDQLPTTIGSPPLQVWIVPALSCAMAYALYNIFIKKGSSHINPVLGGVILQLVAALLGIALITFLIVKEGGSEVIVYDAEGLQWAVLAGVAVGAAEITSFFVSSLGVQAMQVRRESTKIDFQKKKEDSSLTFFLAVYTCNYWRVCTFWHGNWSRSVARRAVFERMAWRSHD